MKRAAKVAIVAAGFIALVGISMANPTPAQPGFSPAQRAILAAWVNADGYDCASPDEASRHGDIIFLSCHGSAGQFYGFELEDHGGKWSITAD